MKMNESGKRENGVKHENSVRHENSVKHENGVKHDNIIITRNSQIFFSEVVENLITNYSTSLCFSKEKEKRTTMAPVEIFFSLWNVIAFGSELLCRLLSGDPVYIQFHSSWTV